MIYIVLVAAVVNSITAGTALLRAVDGKDLEDLNIYAVEAIMRWKAGINLATLVPLMYNIDSSLI